MTAPARHPGSLNTASRAERAAWIREQLATLPRPAGISWPDHGAARLTYRDALDRLRQTIEACTDRPQLIDTGTVTRVSMLGLTATSTAGLEAALRNWITRATT